MIVFVKGVVSKEVELEYLGVEAMNVSIYFLKKGRNLIKKIL